MDTAAAARLAFGLVRRAHLPSAQAYGLGRILLAAPTLLQAGGSDGEFERRAAQLVSSCYAVYVVHAASRTTAHRGLEHQGHPATRLDAREEARWAGAYLVSKAQPAATPAALATAMVGHALAGLELRAWDADAGGSVFPTGILALRLVLRVMQGRANASLAGVSRVLATHLGAEHTFCWRWRTGQLFDDVRDRVIPLLRLEPPLDVTKPVLPGPATRALRRTSLCCGRARLPRQPFFEWRSRTTARSRPSPLPALSH